MTDHSHSDGYGNFLQFKPPFENDWREMQYLWHILLIRPRNNARGHQGIEIGNERVSTVVTRKMPSVPKSLLLSP